MTIIVATWIASLLGGMTLTAAIGNHRFPWTGEALDLQLDWAVQDRIATARSIEASVQAWIARERDEQTEWARLLKLAKLKEAARITLREVRVALAERKAQEFRASVVLPGIAASLDLPAPTVPLVTDWAVLRDMGLLVDAAELQRVAR